MTTLENTNAVTTFSELQAIVASYALNENLGQLSQKNAVLSGNGVLFSPLPEFYFGHCGPIDVESTLEHQLYYDVPVFAAILVLGGANQYTIAEEGMPTFLLQKNMFLAGYWDNVDVKSVLAKQASYSHIGFIFTKTALETYFGKTASSQIRDRILKKSVSGNTVAGMALSDTVFRAQQAIVDTQNCSVTNLLALRGIALDCFGMLVNNISSLGLAQAVYPPHQMDAQRISELKAHIDENLLWIETARDVCAKFGMSFSKANNLFKTLYSTTISQYIHDYKMAYAYSKLVSRQCNVTECAIDIGYSNISHFISSFKKKYNITPKAATRLRRSSVQ